MSVALDAELIALMRTGDHAAFTAWLAEDADACVAVDSQGMTLLHWAVATDQPQIVADLLNHPAVDMHAREASMGRTPLHLAANKGKADLVQLLLDAGANATIADKRKRRPLDLAKNPATIKALQQPTLQPALTLHDAIKAGAVRRVYRVLMTQPALRGAVSDEGRTALHWAVVTGSEEMVAAVLAAGVPVMHADAAGSTPLHVAAIHGNLTLTHVLLAAGAHPQAADYQGFTPLHVAAGHGDATRYLAPPSPPDPNMVSEVIDAGVAFEQCAFDFELLVADPPAIRAAVTTPVTLAPREDAAIAAVLLDIGVDSNTCAYGGVTPLHLAADEGDAAICSLLIAHGALLDPRLTVWSATPLHLAAVRGHDRIIELLRNAGADVEARDSFGRTYAELCAEHRDAHY